MSLSSESKSRTGVAVLPAAGRSDSLCPPRPWHLTTSAPQTAGQPRELRILMAEQAELAFIKSFSSNLATLPLQYPDDYAQPPQNSLRRVPVLQVRRACFTTLRDLALRLLSRAARSPAAT